MAKFDFIPRKDFLLQTIPHFFHNDRIGVVQTKWEHLNEEYSLLTRLQAFGLDAHFTVEQVGRNKGEHFINFNGTAGVWRKSTIYDAGGWESDTITEDLDLTRHMSDAVQSLAICLAADESVRSGHPVKL
jgi:cellulose synthase/poly-beta-1,6-N-acetylglucosamine synthase-like glycosyltransferase